MTSQQNQELRKCSCCGCTQLLATYFTKNRKGDYLKTCTSCRDRFKRRNARPDVKAERQKVRDATKAERVGYDKEYRAKNSEWKKQLHKEYYENPEVREKARARVKQWVKDNPDKINTPERRKQRCEYQKNRRDTIPAYKIANNLRTRVRHALNGNSKVASTMELVGCTPDELKKYLEDKFEEGMSWDIYGHSTFHIDHIIPCASFDLTDPEQQKTCFHYTNLQPLWATENMQKSDKLDWVKQ